MPFDLPLYTNKVESERILRQETLEIIKSQNTVKIYTDDSVNIGERKVGSGVLKENTKHGKYFYMPGNAISAMDDELLALHATFSQCVELYAEEICTIGLYY